MSIYEKLFDWQKKIVDTFESRSDFGIFLDCGLGKTPVSLAFAERHKATKIIVVTINGKAIEDEKIDGSWLHWAEQMELKYSLYNKKSKQAFDKKSNEIFIINYESLFSRTTKKTSKMVLSERIKEFIDSCGKENIVMIVDESHNIKSLQAQKSLAINRIKQELKFRAASFHSYLLTGTPFTQGFIDLYAQLKFLGYSDNKETFCDNFCVRGCIPGLLGWQQPIVGYKNIPLLYDTIHKYAITIKNTDVIKLPGQTFVKHEMPLSIAFNTFTNEKLYQNEICKFKKIDFEEKLKGKVNNPFYRNLDYPDTKYLAETTGAFWLRSRQISIGFLGNAGECEWYDTTRLKSLEKFLSENEDNYVLFYNFTPELLEIYSICEKLGYNIDVYSGEVKSTFFYEKYSHQSEEEQLVNKKNIILANFASGSTGMNWQNYHQCILFSIPLFKDYTQALARIYRIGQKDPVVYHTFYQNNWLDKSMIKALEEGKTYNNDMFESDYKKEKLF